MNTCTNKKSRNVDYLCVRAVPDIIFTISPQTHDGGAVESLDLGRAGLSTNGSPWPYLAFRGLKARKVPGGGDALMQQ